MTDASSDKTIGSLQQQLQTGNSPTHMHPPQPDMLLGTGCVVAMVTTTKQDREGVHREWEGRKEAILTPRKALLAKQH